MKNLVVLLLLTASAFAQGGVYAGPTVVNGVGQPIANASVYITLGNPCGTSPTYAFCNGQAQGIYNGPVPPAPLATVYKDITLGTTITNPIVTDPLGNWTVYATPGVYWALISGYQIVPQVQPIAVSTGTGSGGASLNCPTALNGSIGAFTAPTTFSCDPNFSTDFSGNWTSQSGRTVGPVNGMLGIVGGGTSPGTLAKFKLGGHEFRWLGGGVITPYYAVPPLTLPTNGQIIGAISQSTDGNGDPVVQLGWQNNTGGVTYPNAANPSTPVVTNGGTPGSTTYSYEVVCTQDGLAASLYHSAPSSTGTTTTGNATLSNTNYNLLAGYADTLYGYRGCNVYRTAGGATQGLIAANVGNKLRDTGLAGDGSSPPSTNTSILDPTGPSRGTNQCNSIFHSPEGVDAPPCSPVVYNDEFTKTFGTPGDVNDGVWQPVNAGSAVFSWTNGELTITSDTHASSNLEMLANQNALPTTPYTFEAFVDLVPLTNTSGCALGLRESATGKMVTALLFTNQPLDSTAATGAFSVGAYSWTNATTPSAIHAVSYHSNGYYVKVQNTGTNIVVSYSPATDGTNFITLGTIAVASAFTTAPNQLIVGVNSAATAGSCTFDYVRRTQ